MSTQEEVPSMARESLVDIDLHHQLKCRAYNLYDRLQTAAIDGDLTTELGYVASSPILCNVLSPLPI